MLDNEEHMPIYEYRRPDGTTFEIMQKFSDPPLEKDPDTGVPVDRVFHAPSVHFKGKGFYNTDYGTRKRARETASAAESGSNTHNAKHKEKASSSSDGGSGSSSSSSSDSSSSSGSSGSSSSSSSSD
jgi:putative FmdB family regulatory protein